MDNKIAASALTQAVLDMIYPKKEDNVSRDKLIWASIKPQPTLPPGFDYIKQANENDSWLDRR